MSGSGSITAQSASIPGEIDPSTGRPFGDHGEAQDAIDFVLDELRDFTDTFLRCWREGDLREWPEFYLWLDAREDPASDGPTYEGFCAMHGVKP